jgi:sodium/hydrogen antiporter
MSAYILLLLAAGILTLLTAWLPMILKELPLSLPILSVVIGATAFWLPGLPELAPHPQAHLALTERITELVVIIALMGAGLKLDRTIGWASAAPTWRLLVLAMPLTIAALAVTAHLILGLGIAAAVLLGAVLAPTDPVLASDVQVGPPRSGEEDQVRFTLTSEAGLNDGLAFPFVNLAILLALWEQTGEPWLLHWLTVDVGWKLTIGAVFGWLLGRGLGWLTFRLPQRAKISRTGDGFVALGITAVTYAVTELAQGYGFLAVFVAAVAFRSTERDHAYHEKLHEFIEQLERLLMVLLLVAFGAALGAGGLLSEATWEVALFTAIAILLIRPLAGWLSLLGRSERPSERAVISFFGIRGLGSIYYLAYALGHAPLEEANLLWSAVGAIILVSVLLHGVTVTPIMRHLDRR